MRRYLSAHNITDPRMPHTRGFTLVETLIAIAILMVAIAGPLTVANKALVAARGSRNAMIATYLAQDGLESIKNIKDNNLVDGASDWLLGMERSSCSGSGSPCSTPIWNDAGSVSWATECQYKLGCRLFLNETDEYTYYDSSLTVRTPFTRYFFFSNDTGDNIVATVVVQWLDGTIPNEIRLQSYMTNTQKI